MNRVLKLFTFIFSASTAFCSTPFSWPVVVSNFGPYTVTASVTSSTVFAPNGAEVSENDMSTHRYNHATRIGYYQGTIFVAWASVNDNEGAGGAQVAVAFSHDRGQTWTVPLQVVPSQSTWTSNTFVVGSRWAYARDFELYNGTNYLNCAVDTCVDSGGHVTGATLMSCAVYTNNSIGPLFRIASTNYVSVDGKTVPPYDPVLGPPLFALSKIYGVWGGSSAFGVASEWIGWIYTGVGNFTEPNSFSADATVSNLYRFWRCTGEADTHHVYLATSGDSGLTWSQSPPVITGIPNEPSETTAVRLSTGQFAIIGNPQDSGSLPATRDPLFLAITDPTTTSITNVTAIRQGLSGVPVYPGLYKNGGASYCSAIQVGNYLYIGYSIAKEQIGFSRVLIPGLPDNNNDIYIPPVNISVSTATVGTLRTAP